MILKKDHLYLTPDFELNIAKNGLWAWLLLQSSHKRVQKRVSTNTFLGNIFEPKKGHVYPTILVKDHSTLSPIS